MVKIFLGLVMICSLLIQPPPIAVGSLRLVVYDYATNTPIANAVCCIPEINGYFLTDENGNSTVIDIPIEIADTYDSTQRKKYGEITLFVYKKGYVDYVRFNVKVNGGVIRLVEKIYLYKSTAENYPPQVYSELPDIKWTNELIRKYKR